ncbi:MAG: hypothetical protein WCU80_01220 [Paludibacteraceae bacterium]
MAKKKFILLFATLFLLLLVFLCVPHFGSGEVRRLTEELERKTDSLDCLTYRYDSLLSEYGRVESSLVQTESHLRSCRSAVDSLSKCRRNTVNDILVSLRDLLDADVSEPAVVSRTKDDFRF